MIVMFQMRPFLALFIHFLLKYFLIKSARKYTDSLEIYLLGDNFREVVYS